MPKESGIEINFQPLPINKQTHQYFEELPERMEYIRRMFVKEAGQFLIDVLDEKMPDGEVFQFLREALVVREIGGTPYREYAQAAVTPKTTELKKSVRDLPPDNTLLVVGKINPRLSPPPQGTMILRQYNPWTTDTIPFIPDRREASVQARKTAAAEVERVRKERTDEYQIIIGRLKVVGVNVSMEARQAVQDGKVTSEANQQNQDMAIESLRYEFGVNGMPFKPHWKPAVTEVLGSFVNSWFAQSHIQRIIGDSSFKGWKKLLKKEYHIKQKRAEDIQEFQKKILG